MKFRKIFFLFLVLIFFIINIKVKAWETKHNKEFKRIKPYLKESKNIALKLFEFEDIYINENEINPEVIEYLSNLKESIDSALEHSKNSKNACENFYDNMFSYTNDPLNPNPINRLLETSSDRKERRKAQTDYGTRMNLENEAERENERKVQESCKSTYEMLKQVKTASEKLEQLESYIEDGKCYKMKSVCKKKFIFKCCKEKKDFFDCDWQFAKEKYIPDFIDELKDASQVKL